MKIFAIDEHKNFKETMSKAQIIDEMVSAGSASGTIFSEPKKYTEYSDGTFSGSETVIIGEADVITVEEATFGALVDTVSRSYRPGDKIVIDCYVENSSPKTITGGILTDKLPGDDITLDDLKDKQTTPCYYVDEYGTMEFVFEENFTGYAAIVIAALGKKFHFKNPRVVIARNNRCVQLQSAGVNVFPSTCEIINVQNHTGSEITIGNREEKRYTNTTFSAPVTITATRNNAEDFYAMIVCGCNYAGTAEQFILSDDIKIINPDFDMLGVSVLHINLYYDGFNMCAVVSGY